MVDFQKEIEKLVNQLNKWTISYDEGNPAVSDKEWDCKYFALAELEAKTGIILPNSPTQKINYEVVSSLKKVTHNHPMLSLDKTKNLKDIENFLNEEAYVAMCKMDGLTCTLTYQDGKLISAETRGNGEIGEDILHNAITLSSIPKKIPKKGLVVIDGEIICTYNDFEPFSNLYKNPRNFAAGSIRLLDSKECVKRKLTFVAWEGIEGFSSSYFHHRLEELRKLNFIVVPYLLLGGSDNPEAPIFNLKTWAKEKGFPIDGIVYKFDDIKYGQSLGVTAHHLKNAMAYKFYDETYLTEIKKIEWTMGRTGTLTPIAVFEPVDIDGSIVERASLHNLSIFKESGLKYQGQKIEVFKANQIIPQIARVYSYEGKSASIAGMGIPEFCPICGKALSVKKDIDSEFLICVNPSCEGKLINQLDHFCGKKGLDIKGLSKATLEKLISWGWVNKSIDLFTLNQYQEEWIKKPSFGEKSVEKILNAIENSKSCNLENFIASLGIPLIGSSAAKILVKQFLTWEEFINAVEKKFDFSTIEGFGPEMNKAITNFDFEEAKNIRKYLTFKNNFGINTIEEQKELKDFIFVITGKLNHFKNRDDLKNYICSRGGKVTDSVSAKTTYLINNDKNSTSSKNRKAKELNIPILSEEEFIETFKSS